MNNPRVKIKDVINLSDHWYKLDKVVFDYQNREGKWQHQYRECYDRGNGACILLYNSKKKTVILTCQFRMPSYLNGNQNGMMIEVCAGLLDDDDPKTCVIKEAKEETGYMISRPKKVFELYSTPGAVTEKIHYFIAEYDASMKVSDGGGLESESEEIEVLEIPFQEALEWVNSGKIIDAKTVILLQYLRMESIV